MTKQSREQLLRLFLAAIPTWFSHPSTGPVFRASAMVLFAMSTLCASCSAQTSRAAVAKPLASTWREELQKPFPGLSGIVRYPSGASNGDSLAIVAQQYLGRDVASPIGAVPKLWTSWAGFVPLPAMPRASTAKLAFGTRGELHMVWATFDTTLTSVTSWIAPKTAIWMSTLFEGLWTTPVKVFQAEWIQWGEESAAPLVSADRQLHIIVSVMDSAGYRTVDVHGRASAWQTSTIGPGATYVDAAHAGRRIHVALISGESFADARVGYFASTDDGETWSSHSALSGTTHGLFVRPKVVAEGENVHVFWFESRGNEATTRLHARTRVRAAWAEHPTFEMRGAVRRAQIGATGCGTTVLLADTRGHANPASPVVEVLAVTWNRMSGFEVTRPFAAYAESLHPAVFTDKGKLRVYVAAVPTLGGAESRVLFESSICHRK